MDEKKLKERARYLMDVSHQIEHLMIEVQNTQDEIRLDWFKVLELPLIEGIFQFCAGDSDAMRSMSVVLAKQLIHDVSSRIQYKDDRAAWRKEREGTVAGKLAKELSAEEPS